jgi:hypothetical protein
MEQHLFYEWPAPLRAWFDGTSLATKTGFTASLVTLDNNGHLRTSLLGVGELYVSSATTIAIALWPRSRSAQALATRARAALTFVVDEAFYQVQLRVASLPSSSGVEGAEGAEGDATGLVYFSGTIETGEAQRVRYARLTGGIAFELEGNKEAELDRWEKQIVHLRLAAEAAAAMR